MEERKTEERGREIVPRKRSNNRDRESLPLSLPTPAPVYSTFSARDAFHILSFSFFFFLFAGAIGYDVKIRAAVSRSGSKLSLPGGEKSVPRGDGKRWWWQKWVVAVKTRSLGDRLSADLFLLFLLRFFSINL